MRKINLKEGVDNKTGFKMDLRLSRNVILLGLCFALVLSLVLTSSANASVLENYSEGVKISTEIRPDIQQITEKLNKRIMEATAEELGWEDWVLESRGVGLQKRLRPEDWYLTTIAVGTRIYDSDKHSELTIFYVETADEADEIWQDCFSEGNLLNFDVKSLGNFSGYPSLWGEYTSSNTGYLLWKIDRFIFESTSYPPEGQASSKSIVYNNANVLYKNAIRYWLFDRMVELNGTLRLDDYNRLLKGEETQLILELNPKSLDYEGDTVQIDFTFIAPVLFEVDPPLEIISEGIPLNGGKVVYANKAGIATAIIQINTSATASEGQDEAAEIRALYPAEAGILLGKLYSSGTKEAMVEIGTSKDLFVSPSEVSANLLVHGEKAKINATVTNTAFFTVSNLTVQLAVNDTIIQNETVTIPGNSSFNVTFDEWNVSWSVKDSKKQPVKIEVIVDPEATINETNETNNRAVLEFPLAKGEKKADADGQGFIIFDLQITPYAVPIALWYDDDAASSPNGMPTRHYNPITTSMSILDDIEHDFNGKQYPNGKVNLTTDCFGSDAKGILTSFWLESSGIVIVNDSIQSKIAGAPIASYLNWPMVPCTLIKNHGSVANDLIADLNITYALVIGDTKASVDSIINDFKNLELDKERILFVRGFSTEPQDNLESPALFEEVLEAFGDKASSIIVTNSRSPSSLASAPVAAFYRSMILDIREVVTGAVSYVPNTFTGLNPINIHVNSTLDKADSEHDVLGFISKYMPIGSKTLYLVGSVDYVPFGIEKEPTGLKATDHDSDWIASDYRYYHADPNIEPGGRMALEATSNLNFVARALQFDELPVGDRDVGDGWEDNVMGVGIYNTNGKRNWTNNKVWWLDSVVYQAKELGNKSAGIEITRLFEDASAHNGGWGENWYRFDNRWGRVIVKAPLYWDIKPPLANPGGPGVRGDGANNDNDKIGSEKNNGKWPIERIRDNNNDGVYDVGDDILNAGLVPGIQSNGFEEVGWYTTNEEVWDGYDNDGDGTIDEDCSRWHLLEVEEVYNEKASPGDNMPNIDPSDFIDLIDTNLINELEDKGIVIYSGHSWNASWDFSNIGGNRDPDGPGPKPPLTSDNRTDDDVSLTCTEVPAMAPSLVIASSCGSCRAWEANSIALEFLKKGSLAYIGATSLAYGSSDEFRQQMFDQIADGKLHIGRAFKSAVDNLNQNGLWSKKFGENNIYADITRYEFNLFGLGSIEIDPGEVEKRVTYGTPVYDVKTKTWGMNITFNFPEPIEISDAGGTVTEIIFPPNLLKWFSDDASYPALYLLPLDYELPVGGNFSNISLVTATVYKVYSFSQYKLKDYCKAPVEIVPMDMLLSETMEGELEYYAGPLFPDVLFVNGSEHDTHANRDRVFGSVATLQVNGTINKTIVYDNIVLKLTYIAPIGVAETHVVDEDNLTVNVTIASTDGRTHLVTPTLRIETVGGLIYRTISSDILTVGTAPQTVTFEANDIKLSKYVSRIILMTEDGDWIAETSFTVTPKPSTKKTIYVDDDFTDDPANHKWNTIQKGITDANDGDTVLVYTGTYYETVVLNKSLTLVGEGRLTIDASGTGNAINITADNCIVKGFRCVNAYHAGLRVESNNNVIEDNTCNNNDLGIVLETAGENIIAHNTAKNNDKNGIYLQDSNNNRITDNTASNNLNYHGISLDTSNNNEIRDNIANYNHYQGIRLRTSNENIIANNAAENNGDYGIALWTSDANIVANNMAKNNGEIGILLSASQNNKITDNDASNTVKYDGISLLDSSSNNEIANNTANSNNFNGIRLYSHSNKNILTNNIANSNREAGIHCWTSSGNILTYNDLNSNKYGFWLYNYSTDNILANNTATSNSYGIYVAHSSNNNMYLNNFVDNTDNAYSYNSNNIWRSASKLTHTYNSKSYWNYLGNYWCDYRGSDTDGDGIGDSSYSIDGDEDEHPLMKPRKNYFAL